MIELLNLSLSIKRPAYSPSEEVPAQANPSPRELMFVQSCACWIWALRRFTWWACSEWAQLCKVQSPLGDLGDESNTNQMPIM